jgi:alkaline phosphatase D
MILNKIIFVAGMLLFMSSMQLYGQCGLQAGPMNGHSAMAEVTVWVQTKCAQEVQMHYWIKGRPDTSWLTNKILTRKKDGYTAHLVADEVSPGNTYDYEILIDQQIVRLPYPCLFQTQELWQWRDTPPDFKFVAGSCMYVNEPAVDRPGKPYGGNYEIFTSIHQEEPDFMIWLGDNMYLREVDWNSKTGIYHRNTYARSLPELQPLLAGAHHFATWDDHDFGPNDSDRSYWGKHLTREAFEDFWANPVVGVGESKGITGIFQWADCDFFIMDNRWYRGPIKYNETYFGEIQINWLIDALQYSDAPFKFICTGGQILSNAAVFENYENFKEEKELLMRKLDQLNIKGVVFLTGDRHHSEISKFTTGDGDVFYDITSSALTSRTYAHPNERNTNRIPDSMIGVRNYATISVTGPTRDRKCAIEFKNSDGELLFQYVLEK